jgi:hypothetical protein
MTEIPTLLEHLEKHQRLMGVSSTGAHCECGWHEASYNNPLTNAELHRAHVAEAWQEARTIRTDEELSQVPAGWIVEARDGSITARFDQRYGVLFGDERPYKWSLFHAPALVVWTPRDGAPA